jgi:NAD-dependent dihydropyrimidine dehydrogenase PreA subunit
MTEKKVYVTPNRTTPNKPVIFNQDICNGCNRCVEVCEADILMPNPEKGKPPIIPYPEECWYEGCCVLECPKTGAVELSHPLRQRVRWKRKDTGEQFRVK